MFAIWSCLPRALLARATALWGRKTTKTFWTRCVWDEKILCVPVSDPNWNYLDQLPDVPPHFLKEIAHFFCDL
ncbi:hypothetical protein GWO43_26100 [candidate division KSB1 bacterium]|nr:hypothetical protein [candidate division KSB1 bacterium]NIV70233.1 hypothetical protein [Phycisphaerae bacterium]NIR71121.1 hypothetical protein [candidate division KSB1 bacterium]NIS26137.1 hypothetical protein [candidate division KSB1 bacterium]NIT74283.1 hypothetical protein [candidate division KSB1 bacterium]